MNNDNLPRMRSPHAAISELKERDPDTAFTERALRSLLTSGKIPSVRIGKKWLVNMDCLYDYLYNGIESAEKEPPEEPAFRLRPGIWE